MLFADVVRSMELAERLEPDELSEVMQGLFVVCRDAVEEFGGTVDKFTGDGVMALFGAPVAQEDHARRAGHAALRLLEQAGQYTAGLRDIDLAVRVGLNSGEVVAGSVGEAFTAIGHTVGLAQRMESLAEPGTIRLTEATATLLGAAFLLRDLGPTPVKGSSVPLRVHALDGVAGGSSAAGRRRSGSVRLVGRGDELALLTAALTAAQAGRAQVVGLVGEAGAGKSRLCDELARVATGLGVTVRRTAGVSHAQSVALLPILGFLRDYFAVQDSDSAAQVRAKVADVLIAIDTAFDADLPLLFDFLEVPDPQRPAAQLGPEARRRRVLDVFARVSARRSQHTTLLLILEDLHWFDVHSITFLQAWLPSFAGTRTLVVTNFRPEFHAPWVNHSIYRHVSMTPLEDSAVLELLDELLGLDPALASLRAELGARTGGNPFFLEEIVRGLASDGTLSGSPGAYRLTRPAAEVVVPATVQAVLADRIDRLAPAQKSVLAAAAVIGRTFAESVLRGVAGLPADAHDATLQALCAGELIAHTEVDGEYRFWHPLTQEVAYGGLLGTRRRRLHRQVAERIIELGLDRLDELAPVLVTHFEAAGEGLEAARWQLRTGIRASRNDQAEAESWLRSAIAHAAEVPGADALAVAARARAHLVRVVARAGRHSDAVTEQLLAEARADAERLGAPAALASVCFGEGNLRLFRDGDVARAVEVYAEGRRQAELAGDQSLAAFGAVAMTVVAGTYCGPIADGLAGTERMIALCAGDPWFGADAYGYSIYDATLMFRARLLSLGGALPEAQRTAAAVRANYAQRPGPEWATWALAVSCQVAELVGEPVAAEAAAWAESAAQLETDAESDSVTVKALQAAGCAALIAGRFTDAHAAFVDGLEFARRNRSALMEEAVLLVGVACAQMGAGDVACARAAAEEAVAVARRQGALVVECWAHLICAQVRRLGGSSGDLAEARTAVAAGEALAGRTGALTYAAFLAEERARLDQDPVALKACADGYDAIGATGHARRLHAELASEPAG